MENPVQTFRTNTAGLNKFIQEHNAEYTGDFVDGTLLDNFMLGCDNGYAAVFEIALTCWTSCYEIQYQEGKATDVWNEWYHRFGHVNTEAAAQ